MNDIILERYYKMVDERNSPKAATKSKEEMERQDKLMAIRLLKSGLLGPVTRGGGASKVVKKKTRKSTPNSAFNAEHALSPQLQAVVGGAKMSRPQVVKQIWAYIKLNGLQDPNDKRKLRCDAKLQALFKKLVVGMFEMNKLLGKHLYKDEDLVDENSVGNNVEEDHAKSLASNGLNNALESRVDVSRSGKGKKIKTEDMVKPEDDESDMSDVDE